MKRLHDHFGAFFRFAVGGDALVSWHSSYSDPTARMFRIAQTYEGGLLIWLMGIIGIVVMADVIINDCTPDRIRIGAREFPIRWKRAFKYRHFIFVALALCYATHPFIAEKGGYAVSSSLFFYWNAFLNIGLAFFDAKERTRSVGWQRAYS